MANTPNLDLHQWDAGDSFLREDFNEDFGKIDAAVSVVKLVELVTTTALTRLDVDVSDIDLMAYRQIEIELRGSGTAANNSGYLLLNNILGTDAKVCYMYHSENGNDYASTAFCGVTLGSPTTGTVCSRVTIYGGSKMLGGRAQTFGVANADTRVRATADLGVTSENLQTINIIMSSGTLKAGAELIIYGVRR